MQIKKTELAKIIRDEIANAVNEERSYGQRLRRSMDPAQQIAKGRAIQYAKEKDSLEMGYNDAMAGEPRKSKKLVSNLSEQKSYNVDEVEDVDDYEDIAIFLRDEKDTFFRAIVEAIELGWKNKIDTVDVAEFAITNTESVINIAIEEDDWHESLHLALYHYEEMEEFEKCTRLQTLIKEIYKSDD